jgi:hypothetical protein
MANVIAYKTSSPTRRALKKGNLVIGVDGNEEYGPTSVTGYINGIYPPEGGYVIYTLSSANNPLIYIASSDDDLPGIAKTLGGDNALTPLEAKHYLAEKADTYILDNIPNYSFTDGLELYLDSQTMTSFLGNTPITNLVEYPTMEPPSSGSVITSSAAPQNSVGSSGWSWSVYPNSNIADDGGVEWRPEVLDPLGEPGVWLVKRRPGGNSESNFQRSSTNMISIDSDKAYTVSYWCKTDDASIFRIHINTTKDGSSYWGYSSAYHNGDGTWQRLTVTVPANEGNTSINTVRVQGVGATNTGDAYVKYFQVEEGENVTDFVSGSRAESDGWRDLSGNGNDVTLLNEPTFDNLGIVFDGSDDDANLSFNEISSDSGSIEMILKRTNHTANSFAFSKVGGSSNRYYLRQNMGVSDMDAVRGNPLSAAGFGSVPSSSYHHLVMTWDTDTVYAYKNGELINSASYTNPGTNISDATLGAGPGNNMGMELARFKLYNDTLSQTDITNNYFDGEIVTNGLVFALDPGNLVSFKSGSTFTNSLTGSWTASIENGVVWDSNNKGYWDFDGVDDYMEVPYDSYWDTNVFGTNEVFTIMCWTKCYYFYKWSSIIHRHNGGYYSQTIGPAIWTTINSDSSSIFQGVWGNGAHGNSGSWGQILTYAPPSGEENDWHHLAFTGDGDKVKLYVNGKEEASSNQTTRDTPISTSSQPITFGKRASSEYSGALALPLFYTRSLSADEISQNYNAHKVRFNHE